MHKILLKILGMFSIYTQKPYQINKDPDDLYDWLYINNNELWEKVVTARHLDDVRIMLNQITGLSIAPWDGVLESRAKYLEALRQMRSKENDKPQV